MSKVFSKFLVTRKSLAPIPSFPYLGDRVLVVRYFGIDSCARVSIPMPYATEILPSFKEVDIQP